MNFAFRLSRALPSFLLLILMTRWTGKACAESENPIQESKFEIAMDSMTIGQKIVARAETYLGTRYKFGGKSLRGLDCSGFVVRVWEDLNLGKLPGKCSALYKLGRSIEPEEARPGDLVFFRNTYRRGI